MNLAEAAPHAQAIYNIVATSLAGSIIVGCVIGLINLFSKGRKK